MPASVIRPAHWMWRSSCWGKRAEAAVRELAAKGCWPDAPARTELHRCHRSVARHSVAKQSGGILGALLSRGAARGFGFCNLASTGNEADLDIADPIEAYAPDDATTAITAYVEGIRSLEKFGRAAFAAFLGVSRYTSAFAVRNAPDALGGNHGDVSDRGDAGQKNHSRSNLRDIGRDPDDFADLHRSQELMIQADRCAAHRAGRQPCSLAQSPVDESHEHSSMNNAIPVGVKWACDKGEFAPVIDDTSPQAADMANEPVIGIKRPASLVKNMLHAGILERRFRAHKSSPRRLA